MFFMKKTLQYIIISYFKFLLLKIFNAYYYVQILFYKNKKIN